MIIKQLMTLSLSICCTIASFNSFPLATLYCPQNQSLIQLGMTQAQVLSACGQPLSKQQMNGPFMQKIPIQQLIYNSSQGDQSSFYGFWHVPQGFNSGSQLEIDVVNNKVTAINISGQTQNASLCQSRSGQVGTPIPSNPISIQIGDPIQKVTAACGAPYQTNQTFIYQAIPSTTSPEVWVYQTTPYQPSSSLTFVDGTLQSIQ